MPMAFVQALLAMGYHPIPLAGSASEKVVDIGIQRTLEALARPARRRAAGQPRRRLPAPAGGAARTAAAGSACCASASSSTPSIAELSAPGLKVFDLEDDVAAFNTALPRVRIIPLEQFDPTRYL